MAMKRFLVLGVPAAMAAASAARPRTLAHGAAVRPHGRKLAEVPYWP
jgi:hypothetical protein